MKRSPILVIRYKAKSKAIPKPVSYPDLICAAKELFSLPSIDDERVVVEAQLEGFGADRIGIPERTWTSLQDQLRMVWIVVKDSTNDRSSMLSQRTLVDAPDISVQRRQWTGIGPSDSITQFTPDTIAFDNWPYKNHPTGAGQPYIGRGSFKLRNDPSCTFQVVVKTVHDATFFLKVRHSLTVDGLKHMIERRYGIPTNQQTISWAAGHLPSKDSKDFEIPPCATVFITQQHAKA